MRVAVLAGGRSSEHDVSLNSAASVREGVAAAGHEVLPVTIERGGDVAASRARSCRCARAAGCSAPTSSSPCCTARSARTGRCRACWSCSTCPTSARACSPRRCAWTRSSSRRSWRPPTCRRCAYAGVRLARWQAEPEAVLRELAVLGTPVFVKPARLGSSVGIAKVWSEAELGPALDARLRPRLARDRRGLLGRAWRSSAPCSATATPKPPSPARSCSPASDWYDYEAKYQPGGMELVVPARLPERVLDEVRRLACDTFVRVGCSGLARVDFFVEDGERVLVNELNTLPGLHRDERVTRSCGRRAGCRSRRCATGCWRWRSSASRPSARSVAFREGCDGRPPISCSRAQCRGLVEPYAATSWNSRISEISALSASGGELGDPDQVVAVRRAAGVELEALALELDGAAADLRPAVGDGLRDGAGRGGVDRRA